MREFVGGKNTIGRTAAVLKKSYKATFNLNPFTYKISITEHNKIHIIQHIILHI